jgi:hypothetical protein
VLENNVFGRIFGFKEDYILGCWRKLHTGELCNMYCLPNIIRMIRPRRIRWVKHVSCMEPQFNAFRVSQENLKERSNG